MVLGLILQIGKLRLREIIPFAQGREPSQELALGSSHVKNCLLHDHD